MLSKRSLKKPMLARIPPMSAAIRPARPTKTQEVPVPVATSMAVANNSSARTRIMSRKRSATIVPIV